MGTQGVTVTSKGAFLLSYLWAQYCSIIFCYFCLLLWGIDFAPACGSPASVSDRVMTSQDYIKFEHVRTWLLSSSLAKFLQFESECFFQVCFNLFLPAYMVHVQFLPLGSCVSFVSPCEDWNFGFFRSEIFKRLLDETHVFGRSFNFCICF